jgi:hypothetical protein
MARPVLPLAVGPRMNVTLGFSISVFAPVERLTSNLLEKFYSP